MTWVFGVFLSSFFFPLYLLFVFPFFPSLLSWLSSSSFFFVFCFCALSALFASAFASAFASIAIVNSLVVFFLVLPRLLCLALFLPPLVLVLLVRSLCLSFSFSAACYRLRPLVLFSSPVLGVQEECSYLYFQYLGRIILYIAFLNFVQYYIY